MTAADSVATVDTADLFSAASRRERVVDWQAPLPVAKAAAAMSGLQAMRAIRDGILPEPPMARLIDFRLRVAEPGRIVMNSSRMRGWKTPSGCCMARPPRPCSTPPWAARFRPCCRRGRVRSPSTLNSLICGRCRSDRARSRRKESSSSSAARPAMPKVLSATGQAILQCTRPRPSRRSARLRARNKLEAFRSDSCYYMTANILWDRRCVTPGNTSSRPTPES
jgi:hypothetical protein